MAVATLRTGTRRRLLTPELVAASIAALAGIAAAVFSALTASQVSSAEQEAQQTREVHAQRLDAYADLLAIGQTINAIANECPAVAGGPDLHTLQRDFLVASARVQLVAPFEVSDRTFELEDNVETIVGLYSSPTGPAATEPDCADYTTRTDTTVPSYAASLRGFGDSARNDLQDLLKTSAS